MGRLLLCYLGRKEVLMSIHRVFLVSAAVLAFSLTSSGDPPKAPDTTDGLAGKWTVEFANGVVETCEIKKDGTASVVEPRRSAGGRVTAKDGSFVVACEDDRLERWTPVGQRMAVEHWYPGSRVPVV